jgi:hypothetical protein
MTTLIFDTLRLSKTLQEKGRFTTEQANALAEALGDAAGNDLATKADIADLRAEIANAKYDLQKWIVGAVGFQSVLTTIGIILALVRVH